MVGLSAQRTWKDVLPSAFLSGFLGASVPSIPLGLVGYPKAKALVAGILGKIILSLAYAYAGYYGWPLASQLLKGWGLE